MLIFCTCAQKQKGISRHNNISNPTFCPDKFDYRKNDPFPMPTTGHLHTLKTGYVYWEDGGKWDNEKRQTIDGRVPIGRIDPDHKGMMFPNRNYVVFYFGYTTKP